MQRLKGLESKTGVNFDLDPAFTTGLLETVRRFDEFAANGKDADFGRGNTLHEKQWHFKHPGCGPNITMAPFAKTGPFYAVILAPQSLDTKGGPMIDLDGQCCSAETGAKVAGLYAAGNCAASISAESYWSGGATVDIQCHSTETSFVACHV